MIDNLDEKRRFASLIVALSDYYSKSTSKGVIAMYWEGLRQYDYEAVEKAAWAHTQLPDESGRWMPLVSDFNKMLAGRTTDQGQIAWSKVDRAVRVVGPYADVAFDDPIIHRVLQDMGGWMLIGSKDDKEWPFVAKEFVTRYQGYKMTGEIPEHPTHLIGMASAQNGSAGIQQPKQVRLLGNVEKARQIASGITEVMRLESNASK